MGIKQDSDGTWTVSLSKRHPVTRIPYSLRKSRIETERKAKAALAEMIIRMNDNFKKSQFPMWKDLLIGFYDARRKNGIMEKTIHSELACLHKWTLPDWGEKTVDSISFAEVKSLLSEKISTTSLGHQRYLMSKIRAVFQFAIEEGYIQKNPTPQVRKRNGDRKIGVALTEKQASYLLEKAREINHEWYPIWALAIYTGMRTGELYALTWDCVDLENGLIFVKSSWNKRDGFKSTKSGNDRVIKIAPSLMPLLKDLKTEELWGAYVLPRSRRWDNGEQALILRNFATSLGLPPAKFHSLRATWATTLLAHGVEVFKVMTMGGWENPETMMLYARKSGIDINGATDCLQFHEHNVRTADVIPINL